jgi:2,3-dihydroxybenzoate decarboxylase
LIFHGTFDRFPRVKLLLGHLGETLPFLLWRFDSRAKLYGVQLGKRPSDYIRENIAVTTSGMFATDPLLCTLNALGRQQVMFSADYPFESADEAAEFIDNVALDADVRQDICFGNAQRLLRL